jgi:formylglycine-generating enzyme required for sulfatase activity
MGCSPGDSECPAYQKPVHQVTISRGFRIGQTEVTQEAWQRIMGTNPSSFKGAKLPVDSVSWDEARNYCQAVGMRLPTEAEWEYAARADISQDPYGDLDQIAWYAGNSGKTTHPVGTKQANPWGLYDMLGNVWEWVEDWYAAPYPDGDAIDPKGPPSGKVRTLRGGAWGMVRRNAHASYRGGPGATIPGDHIGVRCAGN